MDFQIPVTPTVTSSTGPMRSEVIKAFLMEKTIPDFAALYSLDMECQVFVARDGGKIIRSEYRGREYQAYTDGSQTWKSFRIPYLSGTNPEYTDKPLRYDLAAHAEGIGMTGWNWKDRKSIYVAFDFDSITNHSRGLTEVELLEVLHKVEEIEWVTIRTSTSGSGYHVYVFIDPVETANHHEHSALARSILSKMSAITGFDFSTKVDICGSNMWIWHRKMYDLAGNIQGFRLVKKGTILEDIPVNWRSHIRVAKKQAMRTELNLPGIQESTLDDVLNERSIVPLDGEHTRLIRSLEGTDTWWDNDHHLLITHTWSLKQAHAALHLRGIYDTVSMGSQTGHDHNCFCIPRPDGAWLIRRYSNVAEVPPWYTDKYGFSCCNYNANPEFDILAHAYGGIETEKRGFLFHGTKAVHNMLTALDINVPMADVDREVTVKQGKEGQLVIKVARSPYDLRDDYEGFELNKDKTWTRIVRNAIKRSEDTELQDALLRHLVTDAGTEAGWVIHTDNRFIAEPLTHINLALKAKGYTPGEMIALTGAAVLSPWRVVCLPFDKEYPGDRRWNRNAPQLLYTLNEDRDALYYPTWRSVLEHCGQGLDSAIQQDKWCQESGIETGADYLKCWIASMFQEPGEPLPYLFFFGEQNSGKSIFHESLGLLFSPGYMRADNALTTTQGFNGELAGAILCVVEETDLSQNPRAYNKIKDWVTAKDIAVRALYEATCMVRNMTHWVQCSNDQKACPILPGDTRVVMIEVPLLPNDKIIPKKLLLDALRQEASDFLTELLRMSLPASNDRLNIPPVRTEMKDSIESANRNEFETFLNDHCYEVPGSYLTVAELHAAFLDVIPAGSHARWGHIRMVRNLPTKFPKGRHPSGYHIVGNISMSPDPDPNGVKPRWHRSIGSETLTIY